MRQKHRRWGRMRTVLLAALTGAAVWMSLTAVAGENAGENGIETAKEAEKTEDPVTLRMMIYPPYCSQAAFDRVLAKVNGYLEEKINVHLQVDLVPSGQSELTKYLMETPDADLIYVSDFSSSVRNGLLMPLNELLAEEGQDIQRTMSAEQLELGQMDGVQYGLVRNIEMASADGVVMRTDLLEKYGINPDQIRSWDDMEDVLAIIKENEPDIYGFVADRPAIYDPLDDYLAVLMCEDGEVVNFYETEECREWLERLYHWGQQGYLYDRDNYRYGKGSARYFLYELMREGRLFAYRVSYKPGIAMQEEKNYGYRMTEIQLTHQNTYGGQTATFQWGIAAGSSHPKEAMRLYSLLYTDKELNNLFCNGIEGEDYIRNSDGMLEKTEAEQEDPYFFNRNWMLPNGYSADAWDGDMPDLEDHVAAFNSTADRSCALGFWFDSTPVAVEMEQCQAVVDKYLPGFLEGKFDPAVMLPAMQAELKECGINEIVKEKQRQLDEWKKAEKEK